MKYSANFQKFMDQRFNQPCWDCDFNPQGFQSDSNKPGVSDISAHLPFLKYLASFLQHITEFGTRNAFSTSAFLAGGQPTLTKIVSVDIQPTKAIEELQQMKAAGELPCSWEFIHASTIDPELKIDPTDMLFIDTRHCDLQIREELRLHADKVGLYLAFHDTVTDWDISYDAGGKGIGAAITELIDSGKWEVVYDAKFNHGLMVLERVVTDEPT